MNKKEENTKKEFSIIKRAKSFTHAGRGIWIFIKTTPNAWVHLAVFGIVIALGFYLDIAKNEWLMLIIVSGLVFVSEAFNTAIEIDINLTSPQHHPYARDTKDVSAGAVLLSTIIAITVGILILVPYFI